MTQFIATSLQALSAGFTQAVALAVQEKSTLTAWQTKLSGNITGLDALGMIGNLNSVIPQLNAIAAIPGMQAYAQSQYANPSYDIGTAFTSMVSALQAILTWLNTNVPSNAVNITGGLLTGVAYTSTQTAGLLTLVTAALATIA